MLFLTLDVQKEGESQWVTSTGGEGEGESTREGAGPFWNDFKISILVNLYGSDWFDLAAAS